jgi:hypothetical protein
MDGTVTWTTIHNAGNGFIYFCTHAGTSGATEPVWPLVDGGTVVDGTVTWQYGTTLDTQISRAISIGDSDDGAVSYGAAMIVTSPVYDAILEFSGATLDTVFNPKAAAIRLAADMPIDFSGNLALPGISQNNHTLRYTHGVGFPYDPDNSGFGRFSYQTVPTSPAWAASTAYPQGVYVTPSSANGFIYGCLIAGTSGATQPAWPTIVGATVVDGTITWIASAPMQETFAIYDIGVCQFGTDTTVNAVLTLNCAKGAQRQLRFESAGLLRWGVLTGSTPEPGSNVGADFRIRRFDDSGTSLGDALTITRATGAITLGAIPTNAANDAAAASAGVPVGGIYRNGSALMIRVV